MAILNDLEPRAVFHYFEEICKIPHGSSDTWKISNYLVAFAEAKGLWYMQDELGNVIIKKPGTAGYENSDAVIIQSHIDMVCEKEPGCDLDFMKDGLRLQRAGNEITASQTTLGGDDGIGIAFTLAILDATGDTIVHPPIEAVFTVDEEIGMLGAAGLNCSCLTAKRMLNLDSEEEGHLLVSCAGGATVNMQIPAGFEVFSGAYSMAEISISGLTGGHSGVEIDRQGANACKVLGRMLYELSRTTGIRLVEMHGGLKDNAIPREASAQIIILEKDGVAKLKELVSRYDAILKHEYKATDPHIRTEVVIQVSWRENTEIVCMTPTSTKRVIYVLNVLPNGVQRMSRDIDNLVQTSLNLGIMKTLDGNAHGKLLFSSSVRSSVSTEKQALIEQLETVAAMSGGSVFVQGDYPAWEYREDSELRKLMTDLYTEIFGEAPVVEAIHAGLECGLFADKIKGLDCVSYGPCILDIHTTRERMLVDSVARTWEYTLAILKSLL